MEEISTLSITDSESMIESDFNIAINFADRVIAKTIEQKDPYYALDHLLQLERFKNISAIAKAKILHFLSRFWIENQIEADFIETVMSYVGLNSKLVISRYIAIWDMFESNLIPENVQEELKERPVRDLVPIMGALSQGYEFTDQNWDDILHSNGLTQVARIVREDVKDAEPRSNAINYKLNRSSGALYAVNQGRSYYIGKFNMSTDNPVERSAILRIINNIGIQIYSLEND